MTQIILYCANFEDGSLVWVNAGNGVVFNAVKCIERVNTKHIAGRDLRESEYRHKLSTRKIWEIVISANELVDTGLMAFMTSFYKAGYWKIRLNSVDYVVVLDDGDMPLSYLENNKNLPEIKLTLIQKDSD